MLPGYSVVALVMVASTHGQGQRAPPGVIIIISFQILSDKNNSSIAQWLVWPNMGQKVKPKI